MQKIGPGMYVKDGALHLNELELCEYAGVPYTEANSAVLQLAAMQVWAELVGTDNVHVVAEEGITRDRAD